MSLRLEEHDPLDSGTSDSIEPDIVDPLNAFTEFWKLVEDNGVDGDKDSESELSEQDKQASNYAERCGHTTEENLKAGNSPPQTCQNDDSLSASPPTQVPRRSSRKTKGQRPKRLGFTLSPFTAKWI